MVSVQGEAVEGFEGGFDAVYAGAGFVFHGFVVECEDLEGCGDGAAMVQMV